MGAAATATSSAGAGAFIKKAITSSLGAKLVMAVSGLLFYGWLVAHLLGNLGVFGGREFENHYAHFLLSNVEILWAQRLFWMALFPIHVLSGIRLAALNRAARPEGYAFRRNWRQASLASRTMLVSGIVVLAFFVFHLFHFTWVGVANSYFAEHNFDALGQKDVYGMVVHNFAKPAIALVYLVGVLLVGFHLSHGLWSGIQTLGLNGRKWTPFAKNAGLALAILLAAGFAAIPLAALTGLITADQNTSAQVESATKHATGRP
jgi:succinate dehydrogenase / fumarate reductase cytochrome b subunit